MIQFMGIQHLESGCYAAVKSAINASGFRRCHHRGRTRIQWAAGSQFCVCGKHSKTLLKRGEWLWRESAQCFDWIKAEQVRVVSVEEMVSGLIEPQEKRGLMR